MISFILCLAALIAGYFVYGRLIERLFGPTDRPTPVQTKADGVDYIVLPRWKIFMIQFLNIAGLGPIFGAIMGAKFGTSCFLWIVFGCIFAGAVHDYLAAMISLRHDGESLPETVGRYLGRTTKQVMLVFTILLLILVGVNFIANPASMLQGLTGNCLPLGGWIAIILAYYLTATLFPIDKIIGKVYPLFAAALIFMAVGLLIALFVKMPALPELWDGLGNRHPQAASTPIFPILFISVACGAISGFHATQSPLMCRCMQSEHSGRPIFFGAMIVEGIVALIWAIVATYFYQNCSASQLNSPADIVAFISNDWLGTLGGILAVLGVVAAPITTGDTALRSARLIVADMLRLGQQRLGQRVAVSVAIFAVTAGILFYCLRDADGFNAIWYYFSWANQTLAVFTLWSITVYLVKARKCYWPTLLPALFMTAVCTTYLCIDPKILHLSHDVSYAVGGTAVVVSAICFTCWKRRQPEQA